MTSLYSLLGFAKRAGKLLSGITNCLLAVRKGKAHLVLIAVDAGVSKRKVIGACSSLKVPWLEFGSKETFWKHLGSPSCYWAILSRELAKSFLEKYQQSHKNNERG